VRGQNQNKPIPFVLSTADYDGYLFENPKHDDPQKIRYLLLGKREMQVFTEGRRNGRTVKQDYVFEREFNPGAVEFRFRLGGNFNLLRSTGFFRAETPADKPAFSGRPGWEAGVQAAFKGRGGFVTINTELSLVGRNSTVQSKFRADTTLYVRDATYRSTWLLVAVVPEITFRREGRFSVLAGPYIGRLLGNRPRGTVLPAGNDRLFEANNDLKKTDIGVVAGLQYKLNIGKKDLGGILGLRGNFSLSNLDNLYDRECPTPSLCNGRLGFLGATLYYSVNLLKI
jgi:hypothetical protein